MVRESLYLNFKKWTDLAVYGPLLFNLKIRTDLAVQESLYLNLKYEPIKRSRDPCIPI